MTCTGCETSRANAKTAGHRDWREGVCFDHAGISTDSDAWRELMADVTPEMVATAAREMGLAANAERRPRPDEPDLFEETNCG
jgi:hypothetical protein